MTQTLVCNKMKLRKGDIMSFLKNNKGAILFYVILLISTLVIINDVEKDNERESTKYVMTNFAD